MRAEAVLSKMMSSIASSSGGPTTCVSATSECVNAACDFYLNRWETNKQAVLDVNSADATGTTTINNGDALRCMSILTPHADLLVSKGKYAEAEVALKRALETQKKMQYDEPSPFFYPVAATLGKLYYKMGDYATAADTFRDGLFTFPRSFGLTLGLHHALKAQMPGLESTVAMAVELVMKYNDTAFDMELL